MKYFSNSLVFFILVTVVISCKNEPKKATMKEVEKPNLKLLVGTHASGDEQGIYQLDLLGSKSWGADGRWGN